MHTSDRLEWDSRVDTFNQFIKTISRLESSGRYVFRGQRDSAWWLAPSLRRLFTPEYLNLPVNYRDENYIRKLEREATRQFREGASTINHDLRDASSVDCWAHMQHYGMPTRMLDWTRSIWVASYFATELAGPSKDGRIWYVDQHVINTLARNSKTKNYAGDNEILSKEEVTGPGNPVIQFRDSILNDKRIEAQEALHSLCRAVSAYHEDVFIELLDEFESELEDEKSSYFGSVTIASSLKLEIRKCIPEKYSAAALFPGIDGLARSISDYFSELLQAVSQNQPRHTQTAFPASPSKQVSQDYGGTVASPMHHPTEAGVAVRIGGTVTGNDVRYASVFSPGEFPKTDDVVQILHVDHDWSDLPVLTPYTESDDTDTASPSSPTDTSD